MSMNIKDEETHRLARQLARATGQSMTAAVNDAIRERLQSVRGKSGPGVAERVMKIAKQSAPLWKEPYRSMSHADLADLLYDEKGLPKGLK